MREIKFRCWNAFSGVMQSWEDMVSMNKIHLLASQKKEYPVMQFTGVIGCDNVEIFEGDIFVDDESDCELGTASFGRVKYSESQAKFVVVDWKGEYQGDLEEWQSAPIVGNIYENPDLISE